MLFGLKNIKVTYSRVMKKIFDYMLHKYVECYVDDLVTKSKKQQNHLQDLKIIFEQFRFYQLKMNPLKCALTFEDFIDFIVHLREIEINHAKFNVILYMPESRKT